MARGKTLLSLIADLRAETGRTQDVSVGIDELENLKVVLRRTQEILYDSYEWSFLSIQRSVDLANGQRYYDFPSDLNYDRIEKVSLKYNEVYIDIERGIGPREMNIYDSNDDERNTPTQRWDIRNTGSGEQLEVWPIPNTNVDRLYFWGTKKLGNLIQESDTADLDDRLIVLFAAAEILARQKSSDADAKFAVARERLSQLKKNDSKPSEMVQMGLGHRRSDHTRGVDRIIVGS